MKRKAPKSWAPWFEQRRGLAWKVRAAVIAYMDANADWTQRDCAYVAAQEMHRVTRRRPTDEQRRIAMNAGRADIRAREAAREAAKPKTYGDIAGPLMAHMLNKAAGDLSLSNFAKPRDYGPMPNPRWRWWTFWRPKRIVRRLPESTGEKVTFRRPMPLSWSD